MAFQVEFEQYLKQKDTMSPLEQWFALHILMIKKVEEKRWQLLRKLIPLEVKE